MHSLSLFLVTAAAVHAYNIIPEPVSTASIPPLPTLFKRQANQEPCDVVAKSWAAAKPKETGIIYVPAKVAYECLQSVPVDVEGDLKMIEEFKLFLQFQSDLNYLKDGIKTHNAEPLDILAGLDEIYAGIKNGTQKSEYEVQQAISFLLIKAGDFHLHWTSDIQTPLRWVRANANLITFSKDGISLPEIYLASDFAQARIVNDPSTIVASPVKTINGQDAVEFLNKAALQALFHDQDARYNRLYPNIPRQSISRASDEAGPFSSPLTYDGETTEIVFKNGTKKSFPNVASISPSFSFTNVTDGPSFFKQFCTGSLSNVPANISPPLASTSALITASRIVGTPTTLPSTAQQSSPPANGQEQAPPSYHLHPIVAGRDVEARDYSVLAEPGVPADFGFAAGNVGASSSRIPTSTVTLAIQPAQSSTAVAVNINQPLFYPVPVIVQSSRVVQCYYMNDTGYEDVAVLVMPSFEPKINDDFTNETSPLREAQAVIKKFFAGAVKDGKKKLIVDLRGNQGGTIDMGFEAFKQIFPDLEPFGATRYRAHEAMDIFSSTLADVINNGTYTNVSPAEHAKIKSTAGPFAFQNIMDENGTAFKNFDAYYGPYTNNKDTFTALRRYNYSNLMGGYTSAPQFNLTGFGDQAPAPARPFKSDNVVILSDGLCGSTCAIFSQLMREQGKVHTIAVGGRPQNAPMQAVGGTKGAQVLSMDFINTLMIQALNLTERVYGVSVAEKVNNTAVGKIARVEQLYIRSSHLSPNELPIFGRVNSLDNIRHPRDGLSYDEQQKPLEFVYEAADCRLFDTLSSLVSPIPMWRMAVDAKWGNGSCVAGSTGDPTAMGSLEKIVFNKKTTTPENYQSAASGLHTSGVMMVVGAISIVVSLL